MSLSCSLTDGLEISGNSSSAGEAANLRPGSVLLLVVLAVSQSDASMQLTQEAVSQ